MDRSAQEDAILAKSGFACVVYRLQQSPYTISLMMLPIDIPPTLPLPVLVRSS